MFQRLSLVAVSGILSVALIEGSARLYPYWLPPQIILRLGPDLREHLATRHPRVFASVYPEWKRVFVLDEKTGYRLKPNQRVRTKPSIDHEPYWLVTDSLGFRNPREYRQADIAAVGDSMTEGVGLSEELTWVRQLEKMTGMTVANLGIRGYGLPEKVATLKTYGLPKRPQLVLFQYIDDVAYIDDETRQPVASLAPGFLLQMVQTRSEELVSLGAPENLRSRDPLAPISETTLGGKTRSLLDRLKHWVYSHSVTYALGRAIERKLLRLLPNARKQQEAQEAHNRMEIRRRSTGFSINAETVRLRVSPEPKRLEEIANQSLEWLRRHPNWPLFQEALIRLKKEYDFEGALFAIVLIPDPLMLYLPLIAGQLPSNKILTSAVQNVDNHAKLLAPFCAAHDILLIDTTPALRAAAARGEQLSFPVDTHWDAPGHQLIAETIYRFLKERAFFRVTDDTRVTR